VDTGVYEGEISLLDVYLCALPDSGQQSTAGCVQTGKWRLFYIYRSRLYSGIMLLTTSQGQNSPLSGCYITPAIRYCKSPAKSVTAPRALETLGSREVKQESRASREAIAVDFAEELQSIVFRGLANNLSSTLEQIKMMQRRDF